MSEQSPYAPWHGTTIVTVRKGGKVVVAGDGQVSLGQTVIKHNARKVRTLAKGEVIAGFAGATADAFTLFERLEKKLEQYNGQLMRAAVDGTPAPAEVVPIGSGTPCRSRCKCSITYRSGQQAEAA